VLTQPAYMLGFPLDESGLLLFVFRHIPNSLGPIQSPFHIPHSPLPIHDWRFADSRFTIHDSRHSRFTSFTIHVWRH